MEKLTLDTILDNACPGYKLDNEFNEFYIDVCCTRFIVEAKKVKDKYEIRDWRREL